MESPDGSYPKNEKLKSRKSIEALFSDGKSVAEYPVRLVYRKEASDDAGTIRIGVSVSKKHFKKAVDRNYYKRVLRECYRLNKAILSNTGKSWSMMLLYQTKDRLSFEAIHAKTLSVFKKFELKENPQIND